MGIDGGGGVGREGRRRDPVTSVTGIWRVGVAKQVAKYGRSQMIDAVRASAINIRIFIAGQVRLSFLRPRLSPSPRRPPRRRRYTL